MELLGRPIDEPAVNARLDALVARNARASGGVMEVLNLIGTQAEGLAGSPAGRGAARADRRGDRARASITRQRRRMARAPRCPICRPGARGS